MSKDRLERGLACSPEGRPSHGRALPILKIITEEDLTDPMIPAGVAVA